MPVEVILTDRIRDAIEEVFTLDSTTDELKTELQSWRRSELWNSDGHVAHVDEVINRNDANIPFSTVKKVFETLKKGIHVGIKEIRVMFTKRKLK